MPDIDVESLSKIVSDAKQSSNDSLNEQLNSIFNRNQIASARLDVQQQQEARQDSASFFDKWKAVSYTWWDDNTLLTSLVNRANKEDASKYTKEDGFNGMGYNDALSFVEKNRGRQSDIIDLMNAVSTQHETDIKNRINLDGYRREFTNNVLTQKQQKYATALTSAVDVDTLLSFGITMGARGITSLAGRALTSSEVNALALGSSAVSFNRPFIQDYVNQEHRTATELFQEGTINAMIEAIGVKFLTPELKQNIVSNIADIPSPAIIQEAENIGKRTEQKFTLNMEQKHITEPISQPQGMKLSTGKSAEDKVINEFIDSVPNGEYGQSIKSGLETYLGSQKEILSKDAEFMQHMTNRDYESALLRAEELSTDLKAPRQDVYNGRDMLPDSLNTPALKNEIYSALEDTKKIVGDAFKETDFYAQINQFEKMSKDVNEMLDSIKTFIKENGAMADASWNAIKKLDLELKDYINVLKESSGMSKEQVKQFENIFKNHIDDLRQEAGFQRQFKYLQLSEDFVKTLKSDRLAFSNTLNKTESKAFSKLEKAKDSSMKYVKSIEERIANGEKVAKSEIDKAIQADELAQKAVDDFIETKISNIDKEMNASVESNIKLERTPDGFKIGKYKIPLAMGIGLFGTTGAFASDQQGTGQVILSGFTTALIAAVVGIGGYRAFKQGSLGNIISNIKDIASTNAEGLSKTMALKNRFTKMMDDNALSLRTTFNETYAPVKKYAVANGNKELEDLADKALFNGMTGRGDTAEVFKSENIMNAESRYVRKEDELFKKFQQANGVKWYSNVYDALSGVGTKQRFRELVTDAIDNPSVLDDIVGKEFIIQMAEESKLLRKEHGLDKAEAYGVDGIDKIKLISNYVTHKIKPDIGSILGSLSETSLKEVKDTFVKMHMEALMKMRRGIADASSKVDELFSKINTIEDVKSFLDKNSKTLDAVRSDGELSRLLDNVSNATSVEEAKTAYKEFANTVNNYFSYEKAVARIDKYFEDATKNGYRNAIADVFSSFKDRLPLDMASYPINGIAISSKDGRQASLKLSSLYERDDFELFRRYMANISGRTGLARAGYTKIDDVEKIIENIADNDVKTTMNDAFKTLIGNPVFTTTSGFRNITQTASNTAQMASLMTVGFSFAVEGALVAGRASRYATERYKLMSEMYYIFHGYGKDSAMMHSLAEGTGYGQGGRIGNFFNRGDNTAGLYSDLGASGFSVQSSKTMKDLVFKYMGLTYFSDIIERANIAMNIQRLADIVEHDAHFGDYLMQKYGINDEIKQRFKGVFTFNEKGIVQNPDFKGLDIKTRDDIDTILFNMNQYGAQRSTIGGSPHWSYGNALGNALSKLVMYSINSYSNIGLKQVQGMLHGELDSYIALHMAYFGGYISARARDAVLGRKEKTEEEYHMLALMSLPQTAPFSAVRSITNPAILSGLSTAESRSAKTINAMFLVNQ